MSSAKQNGIAPNAFWLLWAGFAAILASGIGFAIRGGILDNWQREFGFNAFQVGAIGGAGLTGFCFGIIIGGIVADRIGYGKLVITAFLLHVLSAVVTFAADPGQSQQLAFNFLYWGTFLYAMANGTLEAVANPLVATLFPHNRTHYLNILHASWPAGLVIGSACGWVLDDQVGMHWKFQLALFLIPVLIYGIMFFGQHMPKSEASKRGLTLGEMFRDVGLFGGIVVCFLLALFFASTFTPILTPSNVDPATPDGVAAAKAAANTANYIGYAIGGVLLVMVAFITNFALGSILLFTLLVAHALVGAVELGTDTWIQNITGNILSSPESKILFVFTNLIMFALRFCVDFIEKRLGLSPVGILLTCSVLACMGLLMVSNITTFAGAMVALAVYAVGKTFFWPTMLAVASDRFPRTGAIAISIMGGVGMMSSGLMGSPGLGYAKDRFAAEELKKVDPAVYQEFRSATPSQFLFFSEVHGLDGKKFGDVAKKKAAERSEKEKVVMDATILGDRRTLLADAYIPAVMAVIYLLVLMYFMTIGGYKVLHIDGAANNSSG